MLLAQRIVLFLLAGLLATTARAQKDSLFDYRLYDSITVFNSAGDTLSSAWAGGFNLPQWGRIDVNLDGKKDLVSFDRDGNNFKVFINEAFGRYADYRHAHEYASLFPQDITHFAYFKDYNNDGKEDIWTRHPFGMRIYKNVSDTALKFELLCNFRDVLGNSVCFVTAQFPGGGGTWDFFNVEVPPTDKPAIADMNLDGKLDVMTFGDEFSLTANTVNYYKNFSTDPDSMVLRHITACWGLFYESDTANNVNLNFYCPDSGGTFMKAPDRNNKRGAARHTGSSMTAFDWGGDDDMDVLVGDISFNDMLLLNNGGDSSKAKIDTFFSNYPSNTTPVDLKVFPMAFYVDVDNDNERDLLISPAALAESMDLENVWYYENTGTDDNPSFSFEQKDFLSEDMIDHGTMAYPAFADINGDSLMDMLIGVDGYMKSNGDYYSRVAYYKGNGTINDSVRLPSFQLVDEDYLDLESENWRSIQIEFGDMNADDKPDMLLGLQDGSVRYFENQASAPGDSMVLVHSPGWDTIVSTTGFASPELWDADADGDLDLLLGELHGTIDMYLNQGDSANPQFSSGFLLNNFGNVSEKDIFGNGYLVPEIMKLDTNGKLVGRYDQGETHLLVGSIFGDVKVYDNLDNNMFGTFDKIDSIQHNRYRVAPSITDVFGDSVPDLFLGEQAGGVSAMLRGRGVLLPPPPFDPCDTCVFPDTCINDTCVPIPFNPCDTCIYPDTCINDSCVPTGIFEWRWRGINLFPNPARERFTVESPGAAIKSIELYDLLGRQLKQWAFRREDNIRQADMRLPEVTSKELMVRIKTFETRDKNLILLRE
jgi:hypothetical protein